MNNITEDEPRFPGLYQFSMDYRAIHGYVAAVVCLFGIAANLANIVVLTRKQLRSSTNLILTWLAVADLITMVTYFPVSIHFYIMRDTRLLDFPTSRSIHWIHFMIVHINSSVLWHTIAIWLTIQLAIFRYLFICVPTRSASLCSQNRSWLAIIVIILAVAILCIPNYLSVAIKTEQIRLPTKNGSLELTEFYKLDDNQKINPIVFNINFWIQAILFKIIPCTLLTVLTILLIKAMHEANKRRMKLKSQGKRDESERARETNRTTGMLLAIVALFLLTELPQGILTLGNIFVDNFYLDVYQLLGDLLDAVALTNNAINFVLYCTMSRQFRETFVEIFCSCCPESRPGWMMLTKHPSTTCASSSL